MVERFNRTIDNYLRIQVNNQQTNLDKCIQPFLLAYRSAVHETTGKTPASIILGRELRLPVDLLTGRPPEKEETTENYANRLSRQLHNIHEEVRIKLQTERQNKNSLRPKS